MANDDDATAVAFSAYIQSSGLSYRRAEVEEIRIVPRHAENPKTSRF